MVEQVVVCFCGVFSKEVSDSVEEIYPQCTEEPPMYYGLENDKEEREI